MDLKVYKNVYNSSRSSFSDLKSLLAKTFCPCREKKFHSDADNMREVLKDRLAASYYVTLSISE